MMLANFFEEMMRQDLGFRSQEIDVALAKVVAAIDRQNLSAHVSVVDGEVSAAFIDLLQDGIEITSGMGKGTPLEALTGAYFESLEHFATLRQRYASGYEVFRPSEFFIADPRLAGDRALQILAGVPGIPVSCATFTCLVSEEDVFYPAFLTDPHLDPVRSELDLASRQHMASVRRYSSNSGAAIGGSEDEAILHGINEVVERDILSRALAARAFAVPHEIGKLSIENLPLDLRLIAEAAAEATGTDLAILYLSRPHELPTFLILTDTDDEMAYQGSGSCLCPFRAFRRAVTEYVQFAKACDRRPQTREFLAQAATRMSNYKKLKSVAAPRWPHLGTGMTVVPMDFTQVCKYYTPIDPERIPDNVPECLSATLRVVRKFYTSVLTSTIAEFGDNIVVKQVVIPQADRFFLVTMGMPVIPNTRHCSLAA